LHKEERHGKEISRQQENIQNQLTPRGPQQACSKPFTDGGHARHGASHTTDVTNHWEKKFGCGLNQILPNFFSQLLKLRLGDVQFFRETFHQCFRR
jgi:hypothetical protein